MSKHKGNLFLFAFSFLQIKEIIMQHKISTHLYSVHIYITTTGLHLSFINQLVHKL